MNCSMKMVKLIVVFAVVLIFAVENSCALRCYCDACKDSNYTCTTDGVCFASVYLEGDKQEKRLFKCFAKSKLFPPENPIWCLSSNLSNRRFIIECCKNYDFCNRDLTPTLASPIVAQGRCKFHIVAFTHSQTFLNVFALSGVTPSRSLYHFTQRSLSYAVRRKTHTIPCSNAVPITTTVIETCNSFYRLARQTLAMKIRPI